MKHEYSTWVLGFMFGVIFITALINAIDSDDMDLLCNTDNSLIKRLSGSWVCSQTHYAEGYYQSYTTPIVIILTEANVYYNITGYENITSYGIDSLGDSIRINKDGVYRLIGTMSFRGGNSGEYEVELFVNDAPKKECSFFRTTSTNAIGDATLSCILNLNKNDLLIMKIKDLSPPPQNIEIDALNFNIVEVQ